MVHYWSRILTTLEMEPGDFFERINSVRHHGPCIALFFSTQVYNANLLTTRSINEQLYSVNLNAKNQKIMVNSTMCVNNVCLHSFGTIIHFYIWRDRSRSSIYKIAERFPCKKLPTQATCNSKMIKYLLMIILTFNPV